MPSLNEILYELPKEEVEAHKIHLLQELIKQGNQFNLEQDVVFSSGYSCKPLHIFLSENDPERISPILGLLHDNFEDAQLIKALHTFKDSTGKACSSYEPGLAFTLLKKSFSHPHFIVSPGKFGGLFATPHSDDLLTAIPMFGHLSIGISLEQMRRILSHDSKCIHVSNRIDQTVRLEPLSVIDSFDGHFNKIIIEQLSEFHANPQLKMILLPVFINDIIYELLLTTLRKDDGSIRMIVTEILAKEKSPLKKMEELFTDRGVEFLHNNAAVNANYQGRTVYSYSGTLMNLIFNAVDHYIENGSTIDINQITVALTDTADVEIFETIERANSALKKEHEMDESLARPKAIEL